MYANIFFAFFSYYLKKLVKGGQKNKSVNTSDKKEGPCKHNMTRTKMENTVHAESGKS
jgi:hypothetical protein